MSTLSELVQRCVIRLSMVSGIGVQVYAEDRLAEMIWHKFVMVRDELWWDDLMTYSQLTQDANGRPVENVVRALPVAPIGDEIVIAKYADIQWAWHPQRRDPLKSVSRRENPIAYMQSGVTLWKAPDQAKVVRFYRVEPGTVMMVRHRQAYTYFQPDDVVPMDEEILILGAVYDYLEDDGTNPGATEKFMNFFNDRMRQLKDDENNEDVQISPGLAPNSSGWQVLN